MASGHVSKSAFTADGIRVLKPALVVGISCGLGIWGWTGAWLPACVTVAACCASVLACWWGLRKQQQVAVVRLRNRQLQGGALAGDAGIFRPVLDELSGILERSQEEVKAAAQSRADLSARISLGKKQSRRLETAFQCLMDPVVLTDGNDQPVLWNAAAAELFQPRHNEGHTGSSDAGSPLQLMPEVQKLLAETRSRSAATSSRSIEFETAGDGGQRTFRADATHMLDQDGSSLGVLAVIRDIGREKQQNSRHAEFVSSVAHELKTPMSSIKAFIELLSDGDVEDREEQLRLYGFMDMQVDRLTRLVNNMLNLARIESGVIKVQREDCGLNEVLEKALQVVKPVADEKNIRLIPQFSELYLPVNVDRDLLGQAVINLLSNAVKYTPDGGEVRLRSRMTDDEAVIDVQDNGMGIPEEDLGRVFERFYRVARNNKAAAGTGLGLALVQYIVTSIHNGRISVRSQVDVGSCFSIAIPTGHRDQARKKHEPQLCTA